MGSKHPIDILYLLFTEKLAAFKHCLPRCFQPVKFLPKLNEFIFEYFDPKNTYTLIIKTNDFRDGPSTVLLFSKLNKIFCGYFGPEQFFLDD